MDLHDRHISKKLMENKKDLENRIDVFKGESRNELETKVKMLEEYTGLI